MSGGEGDGTPSRTGEAPADATGALLNRMARTTLMGARTAALVVPMQTAKEVYAGDLAAIARADAIVASRDREMRPLGRIAGVAIAGFAAIGAARFMGLGSEAGLALCLAPWTLAVWCASVTIQAIAAQRRAIVERDAASAGLAAHRTAYREAMEAFHANSGELTAALEEIGGALETALLVGAGTSVDDGTRH